MFVDVIFGMQVVFGDGGGGGGVEVEVATAAVMMVATATVSKELFGDCGSGGGGGSKVEVVVVVVATAAVVVLVHSGVYLVVVEVAQLLQQFGRAAAAGLCMRYLDTAATILVFLLVKNQFRVCSLRRLVACSLLGLLELLQLFKFLHLLSRKCLCQ